MDIQIQLFANLAKVAQTKHLQVDLPTGAMVSELLDYLRKTYPDLAPNLQSVSVAINMEYANGQTKLHENDAVALIPPVSGG